MELEGKPSVETTRLPVTPKNLLSTGQLWPARTRCWRRQRLVLGNRLTTIAQRARRGLPGRRYSEPPADRILHADTISRPVRRLPQWMEGVLCAGTDHWQQCGEHAYMMSFNGSNDLYSNSFGNIWATSSARSSASFAPCRAGGHVCAERAARRTRGCDR